MTGTILQRVRTGHGGDAEGEAPGRAETPRTFQTSEIDISVIVPVHNCRPYLDRCLTSLLIQRVSREIVVVDDGSTDGSADLLALYAAYHRGVIRVVRQEHSGGAGRPRNVGISHARGRYVFFCDADDYLGPEALERMLAMADRNDSDIVLGKIVGHDRRAPVSMFRQSAERAPLGESAVYNSLSCFKLFRREMLERHTIRFDETLVVGEDVVFTAHAYCHAAVISVVADYDCYHLVARPDGSSIMQRTGSRDPVSWLRMIRRPIELVVGHVGPGALRDHLLRRHFRLDAFGSLGKPFLEAGEVQRKEIAAEVAEMCDRWLTDGVRDRLTLIDRSRISALQDIDRLVRLAHIESAVVRRELTGLRWDGEGRLVVSGRVALSAPAQGDRPELVGGGLALVLRMRHDGAGAPADLVVPVTGDCDGFTGLIDVAGLSSGVWDVHVTVECEGVTRLARLGADRDGLVAQPVPRMVGGVIALPYFTRPHGNLSLDVGGHVVSVPAGVRLTGTRWTAGHRLRLDGEVTVGAGLPGAHAVRRLVWRERCSGRERHEPVTAWAGGAFATRQAVGRLGPGTWDAYLELDLGGPPARFRIEVEAERLVPPRTWWRGLVRWSVRPYATAGKGRLSAVVRVFTPRAFVKRILR
ncbi:Glycosyltransferase involved in cell wall bisynthesis [Streptosporangium canum]|uniref:Glycosyltransferase involved in cell wall bisynthesis n=1 Tax=Streptosporangium canum TaxID=324952 RepID=A0A1I3YPZ7_9ACTN|nr:glycosyltransferase family 2 protein [Streptosporangium canum]SFK33341.1 Glycosyltransferase involved in cell wall bisynthesis [Streptosporangium canum]